MIDILIIIALVIVVGLAIWNIVNPNKKSSSCCGCASCTLRDGCRKNKDNKK